MDSLGYLLAGLVVVLWGLVQIPIRMAKAPGRVGVMISMPVGLLVLVVVLAGQGELTLPVASRRDWVFILLGGLCNFPLATFAYFEAVQRAGITTAAPVTRLVPILVVACSVMLGIAPFSWLLVFSAGMIFVGGVVLAKGARLAHPVETHGAIRVGVLYALFACVMWTIGLLSVAQVSTEVPRSLVLFYGLGFGALVHWALMGLTGRLKELRSLSRRDILLYSIQGGVSLVFGYWAMFKSIELLNVDRAAVIAGCWPVVGVIAGVVVFREPMNVYKIVGVVLFIGSAVLVGIGPLL